MARAQVTSRQTVCQQCGCDHNQSMLLTTSQLAFSVVCASQLHLRTRKRRHNLHSRESTCCNARKDGYSTDHRPCSPHTPCTCTPQASWRQRPVPASRDAAGNARGSLKSRRLTVSSCDTPADSTYAPKLSRRFLGTAHNRCGQLECASDYGLQSF